MSPRHHPGEELLIAHVAGTLGAGPSLVIAVHLEGCGACRALVAALDVAGGVLLEQLPPASLSSLALARAMAAIERPLPRPGLPDRTIAAPPVSGGVALPAALRGKTIGRWRWLAPGMRWSKLAMPGHPEANVVLMRGRAAALLPGHGHRGSEFTQVLAGGIVDGDGRYEAGDMFVADDATNHHLRVTAGGECLCIVAIEGNVRMNSLVGRIVQPLVGP